MTSATSCPNWAAKLQNGESIIPPPLFPKQAEEALAILKFAPQGASEPVYKLVASAMANARVKADASNEFLDEQDLYVARAFVDEGTTLKRFQPRAQGRAFRINKRTSHITVVLATPTTEDKD